MAPRRTYTRRPSRAWVFDPNPIDLDLTVEEIMEDLDPGWQSWRNRSSDEHAEYPLAA